MKRKTLAEVYRGASSALTLLSEADVIAAHTSPNDPPAPPTCGAEDGRSDAAKLGGAEAIQQDSQPPTDETIPQHE